MSGTRRQTTFGGSFRSLLKDLEDMSIDTRSRYLNSASRDDKGDLDDIQEVEKRIIDAVMKLQVQSLFKHMKTDHHILHKFQYEWEKLQTFQHWWENWRSTWNEHVEQRGDLIARRDWKKDKDTLEKVHAILINAKPAEFEEDVEWKSDYRVVSSSAVATQTPPIDTDSKHAYSKATQNPTPSDIIPQGHTTAAPGARIYTFGHSYRLLLQESTDLVDLTDPEGNTGTDIISKETLEAIGKKKLEIIQIVDSLPKDNLFVHMESGWSGHTWNFTPRWESLVEVCAEWKSPKVLEINHSDWQKDHKKLKGIVSKLRDARPYGFKEHPEWTEEYCAASCSTTVKGRGQVRESTWCGCYIAPGPLPLYTNYESRHITFGGAWRRLLRDLDSMHQRTRDMQKYGKFDRAFWQRILDLEKRIIENFYRIPIHPLFERMRIEALRDRFMSRWDTVKKLRRDWEESMDMWRQPLATYLHARDWGHESYVLDMLSLGSANPEGFKHTSEWCQDYLPVAELMKKDWFLDAEKPKKIKKTGTM
ncbi:MAG: hypothetical protein Q9195_006430 [Heterodermia aff. obscurata]